jgi:hypothetical protein
MEHLLNVRRPGGVHALKHEYRRTSTVVWLIFIPEHQIQSAHIFFFFWGGGGVCIDILAFN